MNISHLLWPPDRGLDGWIEDMKVKVTGTTSPASSRATSFLIDNLLDQGRGGPDLGDVQAQTLISGRTPNAGAPAQHRGRSCGTGAALRELEPHWCHRGSAPSSCSHGLRFDTPSPGIRSSPVIATDTGSTPGSEPSTESGDEPGDHRLTPDHGGDAQHAGDALSCDVSSGRRKKTRTVFSRSQVFRLESTFDLKRYLSSSERSGLAAALRMTETQVKIWFQNRRNKWKRQLAADLDAAHLPTATRRVIRVPVLYHDGTAPGPARGLGLSGHPQDPPITRSMDYTLSSFAHSMGLLRSQMTGLL